MSDKDAEILILGLEAEASAARNATLARSLENVQKKVINLEQMERKVTSFLEKMVIDVTELVTLHPAASSTLTVSSLVSPILLSGSVEELMSVLSQRIELLRELQKRL